MFIVLGVFAFSFFVNLSNEFSGGFSDAFADQGPVESASSSAPFQASLRDPLGRHGCSGALIHEQCVITAAKCHRFSDSATVGSTVLYGSSARSHEIERFIAHSAASGSPCLALALLRRPVAFGAGVRPIAVATLPPALAPGDRLLTRSGWGRVSEWPQLRSGFGASLVATRLRRMATSLCQRYWPGRVFDDSQMCMICENDAHFCQGDMGSPVVLDDQLVAVATFDTPCLRGTPEVHQSVARHFQWIKATFDNLTLVLNSVKDYPDTLEEYSRFDNDGRWRSKSSFVSQKIVGNSHQHSYTKQMNASHESDEVSPSSLASTAGTEALGQEAVRSSRDRSLLKNGPPKQTSIIATPLSSELNVFDFTSLIITELSTTTHKKVFPEKNIFNKTLAKSNHKPLFVEREIYNLVDEGSLKDKFNFSGNIYKSFKEYASVQVTMKSIESNDLSEKTNKTTEIEISDEVAKKIFLEPPIFYENVVKNTDIINKTAKQFLLGPGFVKSKATIQMDYMTLLQKSDEDALNPSTFVSKNVALKGHILSSGVSLNTTERIKTSQKFSHSINNKELDVYFYHNLMENISAWNNLNKQKSGLSNNGYVGNKFSNTLTDRELQQVTSIEVVDDINMGDINEHIGLTEINRNFDLENKSLISTTKSPEKLTIIMTNGTDDNIRLQNYNKYQSYSQMNLKRKKLPKKGDLHLKMLSNIERKIGNSSLAKPIVELRENDVYDKRNLIYLYINCSPALALENANYIFSALFLNLFYR